MILKHFIFFFALIHFTYASQKTFQTSLLRLPSVNKSFSTDEKSEITLPDLHGNALKLLNALVATNLITIEKKYYKKFVSIYLKESKDITQEDIRVFRKLLKKIKGTLKSERTVLRLIGDEFSDRGSNDYWTLLLIKHLHECGVRMEFVISNHSFDFIAGQELGDFLPRTMEGSFSNSLFFLKYLIENGLVDDKRVSLISEIYYKKTLKIIAYTHCEKQNTLTLYTHAPIGLNEIRELAHFFRLEYKDGTINELKQTIDQINAVFKYFVDKNEVHTLFDLIEKFLWNRDYDNLIRPSTYNNYHLDFVHGHDPDEKTEGNIFNLDHDNALGKSDQNIIDNHQIFVTSPEQ